MGRIKMTRLQHVVGARTGPTCCAASLKRLRSETLSTHGDKCTRVNAGGFVSNVQRCLRSEILDTLEWRHGPLAASWREAGRGREATPPNDTRARHCQRARQQVPTASDPTG